jgi:hypothetical protein
VINKAFFSVTGCSSGTTRTDTVIVDMIILKMGKHGVDVIELARKKGI